MEAPNSSGKATEVEPKPSHTQSSTLPPMPPANVPSNVEDEEDELAEDEDVVMTDVATGSSTVSSHPQSASVNLPRSARGAEGETTTAAVAPASAPNSTQNVSVVPVPTKKSHKPRAPKPEKSMMTSFKVRPPKEGTANPVPSTATPPGSVQLNIVAPAPTTEAAPKTSKSTLAPKGQMKRRSRCVSSQLYQIYTQNFLICTSLGAKNPTTPMSKYSTTTMLRLPQQRAKRTNIHPKQRLHLYHLRLPKPDLHRSNAPYHRNNQPSSSQFPSRNHWI